MKQPVKKIAITGALGQIAYQLLFRICQGDLFGSAQPIELRLLEAPGMEEGFKGVLMELEDSAYPILTQVVTTTSAMEAFEDVDLALLIGAKPRGPGMERKDLILHNAPIFQEQGKAIDKVAKKNVQVLVVGNPSNTNCLVAIHQLKRVAPTHFHAMTRLDYNRAIYHLAKKIQQPLESIHHLAIWGNHSATQVPDILNATCFKKPIIDYLDRDYLEKEFIPLIQNRGSEVIKARGKSSAGSAAQAIIDAVRSIYSPQGHSFCSGVLGLGNPYGIDSDLVFSYPCMSNGSGFYQIRGGFQFDAIMEERIKKTERELKEEMNQIRHLLKY
jgi:malate dehydrogenase